MSVVEEFKKFAFKGNVVDLAVGVVIGAAFGKIVSALVADVVMPVVSLILPGGDWRTSGIVLRQAADAKDNVVLRYGDFLGAILDFLVIAVVLFLIVSKLMTMAMKKPAAAAPTTKECPFCIETIPIKAKLCKACGSDVTTATT